VAEKTGRQTHGFLSKKLDSAQQKYYAFDRELFACYLDIRHFRYMLDGHLFAVIMDHKSLTYALLHVLETWLSSQFRHLSYLAEFTSDIHHITGAASVAARTPFGRRVSPSGNLCKSTLRVSGCHRVERKAKLLSTFTSWRG
jgi:hypothetical protein